MAVFERATQQSFSPNGKDEYFYWVAGDEKNEPMLFIAGFTGTHSELLEMTVPFRDRYFVVVPDLPGWGRSAALHNRMTLSAYAKHLYMMLKSRNIKKLQVVGHCMGGVVAIEFAHLFSEMVDHLFLVSVPYEEGRMPHHILLELLHLSKKVPFRYRFLFYLWRNRYTSFLLSLFIIRHRTFRRVWNMDLYYFGTRQHEHERNVEENWESLMEFNYRKMKRLAMPVHLIYGNEDMLIPHHQVDKLRALHPQATLDYIPHSGHVPPIESPDGLASSILRHLT
ncbi:alpha/beta hydrolase [Candidatus Roizmanbacteria bacterium]|nr:alpha/beta hydrolase [Candidatus Roizmanbacteria bacterium]